MNWIDWIGYMAAALVVISFLVSKNMRLLRTINMLGAALFIVYGVLLNINLPVIIPNAVIVGIQVFYLFIKKEESGRSSQPA
jgi:cell shape-determining protein MreD